MRTDPLMSMFPRDSIASEFDTHVQAWREDPKAAHDDALKRIRLLAPHPRLGRVVIQACMDVTGADGRTHPRELEALARVREALGLDPEPATQPGTPRSPLRHGAELSPSA